MADEKWSEFPAATSVSDSDTMAVVQGGTNKRNLLSVLKTYIQTTFDAIYAPLSRTLNIGGTTQSLAANRTWTTNTILDGLGSPAQGDILYRGASNWVLLTPGTDGNVLTTHSTSSNPTWTAPVTGAPTDAHYLTSQAESGLSNEVNLGALSTGLVKISVSGSVATPSVVVPATGIETFLATPSSANLKAAVTDETGSGGSVVFATSPTLTTPDITTGFTIGTAAPSGKIPIGDGSHYVPSTPTFPNASATSGKFIRSDGTNWIASTPTLPTAAGSAGKILASDGTNYVESTPTFPYSASATSGKIIKSDGTNWVASTETYAAPGTSGNVLTSDGTNWTSAALPGGGTTVKVSGSDFTTTSLTIVAVTGLTIAPASNSLYELDAVLRIQSTSTAGVNIGLLQSGSGSTASVYLLGQSSTGTLTSGFTSAFGSAIAITIGSTANTDSLIHLKGIIVTTSSPGNIQIGILKVTSGTATVYIGSRMTMTKLS